MFPPALPPAHANKSATLGYTPHAARTTATYPGPGRLVVYAMMYPIIEIVEQRTTKGPRRFALSEKKQIMSVETPAPAKGGTDSS